MYYGDECAMAIYAKVFGLLCLILLPLVFMLSLVTANPYIDGGEVPPDAYTHPPTIFISSPENNAVYAANNLTFTFNISAPESTTAANPPFISEVYYETDWQEDSIRVYGFPYHYDPRPTKLDFSFAITEIPEGQHNIAVHATGSGWYLNGLYSHDFNIHGSSPVNFVIDTIPPNVTVLSMENKTYGSSDVPLNFVVTEPFSQVTYSLDGQDNVTIAGNTTLTGLANGAHNLTVFATDVAGNTGASEPITFTVAGETQKSFSTTAIAASTSAAIIVGVGLAVYLTKAKRTNQKSKNNQ